MDHIIGLKRPITGLVLSTIFILSSGCSNPWIANGFQAPNITPDNATADTELFQNNSESLAMAEAQLLELDQERSQLLKANKELKSELGNQRANYARLKLAYFEKHAEVNQLILDQQVTIQEMVRIQAKLLSRNSRAETVSTLAEATMLVQKAQEVAPENQKQAAGRAIQLILMSNDALAEENYDGATFLANQAAVMVQGMISQVNQPDSKVNDIDFDGRFAVPIKMKSLAISNVRTEPKMNSDILFSLTKDQEVVADGYISDWIHIILDDDEQGWVYFRLIDLAL